MRIRVACIFVAFVSSACSGTQPKASPVVSPEALPEKGAASREGRASEATVSEPAQREGPAAEPGLPSRCTLPFEPGPCKAAFSVYWFDPERRACEPRIYGGCAGNENRFEDLESCEATCLRGGQ